MTQQTNTDSNDWLDIPGYEGLYAITKDGKVWSYSNNYGKYKHNGRWMTIIQRSTGYTTVLLTDKNSKAHSNQRKSTHFVHRLVALTYIPNPKKLPQVNHLNGIKNDNRVENLEWSTNRDNQIHAIETGLRKILVGSEVAMSKLDESKVATIKKLLNQGKRSIDIAEKFNVSSGTIWAIKKGKTWTHVSL